MSIQFNSSAQNPVEFFMEIGREWNVIRTFSDLISKDKGLSSKIMELGLDRKESVPVLSDKKGGGILVSYKRISNSLTDDESCFLEMQANKVIKLVREDKDLGLFPLNPHKGVALL